MPAVSLERLLRPRSIAVLGGAWARNVIERCQAAGFEGDIWPVHPTRDSVCGLPCFADIPSLPGAPDASFIGVNRHLTINTVRALRERGAGGAVCFASGFSEAESLTGDGASLQQALIEAAGDMPVLGPNCYGFINYLDGALLWPDQHGGRSLGPDGRGVALVMQSSNIAINCTMQARGVPLAYVLCAGNQACVDASSIVDGLLDDDRVSAIGMHIEGLADIAAFEAVALKARRLGKAIVALKVGRSEQAREATMSHTASVAGSDAGSRAFFAQLGVPLVSSLGELLESLKLLHVFGSLPGRSISSMSCSGGEASLVADAVMDHDLHFRPLTEVEKSRVRGTLSELVVPANPLDYHTFIWGDEAALTRTFASMVNCGFDLNCLILDFPRVDRCSDHDWDPTVAAIASVARDTGERIAVVSTFAENLGEARADELMGHGIVPLHGLDDALAAAAAAAFVGEAWSAPGPQLWAPARAAGNELVTASESEAKAVLARYGITVPVSTLCASADSAASAATRVGFPVVAKLSGVAHKTELDGVRLNLQSAQEVHQSAAELLDRGEAVLVEQMVTDSVAEFLVGVHCDPVYGYLLTIGAGGVLVELMADSVTLRLPVTEDLLRTRLGSLRSSKLLDGYRGRPRADTDALIALILKVQDLVQAESGNLVELDLNPVMVRTRGNGAVAADALMVMQQ